MKTGNSNNAEVGVDSQPCNETPVSTTVLSGEGSLSFGAPVFTAVGSMNPSVAVKGQETRAEKWKGTNNVEIPVTTMQLELSPGFVSPEPIYYVPPEYINGYVNHVFPEPLTNGDSIQYGQASGEPTSPMNGDSLSSSAEAPSTEDLKRMIRQQFEYYFSRENLVNDSYLVSQMDNDKFVPIATVARFNQIKKLTSDLALIAEALKYSQHIQLDESGEKVRANVKRCIVILREIPDSTPIQEIQDLFNSPNCPKYTNCEFAHNNSWYVTFDTEEDAQKAYRYLREEVKTFHGKPIMARIKAKTLLSRSTLMRPPSAGQAASSQPETSPQPQPPPQPVFSQRQYNTFTVPTPVIAGQQHFPYYPPGTIVQTAWIEPRQQFFPPEMMPNSHSFVKPITITGPRPFFATTKQRMQTKTFFKADNAERLSDKEERSPSNGNNINNSNSRRPAQNHRNGGGSNFIHKDNSDSYLRRMHPLRSKRDEVVPRFQRLRERERRQMEQNSLENDINNLSIDLAPENFPALPSPISPNERPVQQTATLKDLATNALQQAELVEEEKIEKEEEIMSEAPPNDQPSTSPPLCRTPPPLESNHSLKPSYAQMAQKPILKGATAPKSPTETTSGKEVRKTSSKQDEGLNGQKAGKNSTQKVNGDEKETLKKDSENTDKSGLSPKQQRQARDSRISPDSGPKNSQKQVTGGARSNSYSGLASAVAKESYASKSSTGAVVGSTRSPPTKPRSPAASTAQPQNKNTRNSPKGSNNADQPQKAADNNVVTDEVESKADDQVQVNIEQNNNKKEDEENRPVEEN